MTNVQSYEGSSVFLAPHNDDEVLFGAAALLRHRPLVVIVLRCDLGLRADEQAPEPWKLRAAESVAACAALGCEVEQWPFWASEPDWDEIEARLSALHSIHTVWAPAPEVGGHEHHNPVGELALEVFGDKVVQYMTYTRTHGKSTGIPVPFEPGWSERKQEALAYYRTQHHQGGFKWGLEEYVARQ